MNSGLISSGSNKQPAINLSTTVRELIATSCYAYHCEVVLIFQTQGKSTIIQ